MHVVNNRITQNNFHRFLRIIVKEFSKKHCSLDSKQFNRKFKTMIGFYPKKILGDWISCTGALEINLSHEFSKKNNNVTVTITQRNLMSHYFAKEKYREQKFNEGHLNINNLYSKEYRELFPKEKKDDDTVGENQLAESYDVELSRDCPRWFENKITLMFYETDGINIKPEKHKIDLTNQKPEIKITIPLKHKVRKTNQNKKRDYT